MTILIDKIGHMQRVRHDLKYRREHVIIFLSSLPDSSWLYSDVFNYSEVDHLGSVACSEVWKRLPRRVHLCSFWQDAYKS